MKKVFLLESVQNGHKFYSGVLDGRDLVRCATTKEFNTPQDAQRPIEKKRVEEIATFVASDGTLSTSIVIGTCNDNIQVYSVNNYDFPNLYYMEYPETDEEFEKFKNSFDIMDGQHRLFSFLPEYIKLDNCKKFDLSFEMYIKPTIKDRRLIFKNTNEKQKSVASNLLLWFRKQLGMLSIKEKVYHPWVELLSSEICSPLKGRIIMGSEKISGGLKAEQIISILDKSDIKHIGGRELDESQALLLLSNYLSGWEDAVGSKLVDRDKKFGAFSKIAGFRFMILMLPDFYNRAINTRTTFDKDFISSTLRTLFAQEGLEVKDLFEKDNEYIQRLGGNPFAGETPITLLAKDWSAKLKNLDSNNFDPLA